MSSLNFCGRSSSSQFSVFSSQLGTPKWAAVDCGFSLFTSGFEIKSNSKVNGGGQECPPHTDLADFSDYQDHSRPQGGYVAIVFLQGGYGRVVGTGYRVERFSLLHLVMLYCGDHSHGGGLGCGRVLGLDGMLAGYFGVVGSARYRKVEIYGLSSGEAVAFQAVPDANHFRGDAEIFGYRLYGVS